MKRTRRQSLPSDTANQAAASPTSSPSSSPDAKRARMSSSSSSSTASADESDVARMVKALRAKPDWQRKVADPAITAKWRAEALEQGASEASVSEALARLLRESVTGGSAVRSAAELNCQLSIPNEGDPDEYDEDLQVDYDDRDAVVGVPRDDVCWKDGLVPEELRARLEAKLDAIAAAPEKDFHPGSDGKVQDLIHPSLFPYIRGLSYEPAAQQPVEATISKKAQRFFQMAKKKAMGEQGNDQQGEDEEDEEDEMDDKHDKMKEEEWEDLGADYEAEKVYIREEELYKHVESIYQWLPAEFAIDAEGKVNIESYINNLDREQHRELYDDIGSVFRLFVPLLEMVMKTPLSNKRLQVIVKAANYILQPGQSHEGTWHVEGMPHEHIAASGIYYYSTTPNLAGSKLAFRTKRVDNLENRSDTQSLNFNLNLGAAETPADRCLVFANNLQHKVREMKNESAEIGLRKILCFFVVDPDHRIKSSADIPEQQWDKIKRSVVRPLIEASVQYKVALPREILAMIMEKAKWGFTLEEAKKHREVLMQERKYVITANNELWERPFSFCEH